MIEYGPNGYRLCKRGHERTPDNLDAKRGCKKCASEAKRKDYEANKDAKKESFKEYYRANKEKFREYDKKYQENNKEKLREYRIGYRENNRDKIKQSLKEYQRNNLIKFRLNHHKRRAREKAGGSLSPGLDKKLFILQKGRCRICRKKLDKFHMDHYVPIIRGGPNTDSNMQILCPSCNCRKGAKDPFSYAQELGMLFL